MGNDGKRSEARSTATHLRQDRHREPTSEELEQLARSVAMSGVLGDRDRLDVVAALRRLADIVHDQPGRIFMVTNALGMTGKEDARTNPAPVSASSKGTQSNSSTRTNSSTSSSHTTSPVDNDPAALAPPHVPAIVDM